MIHDQSSTGATVFIEPMAIVNLNNELKELDNQELAEIEKILESLSAQTAAEIDISNTTSTLWQNWTLYSQGHHLQEATREPNRYSTPMGLSI